jgi:hypothetical protein
MNAPSWESASPWPQAITLYCSRQSERAWRVKDQVQPPRTRSDPTPRWRKASPASSAYCRPRSGLWGARSGKGRTVEDEEARRAEEDLDKSEWSLESHPEWRLKAPRVAHRMFMVNELAGAVGRRAGDLTAESEPEDA